MKPTVAIIGMGLIGGSLGQALRKSGRYKVLGIARKPATRREVMRLGAADRVSGVFSDAAAADIVVLAMPVAAIVPTLQKLVPHLKANTIVTDVGSVKGVLMRKIAALLRGTAIRFIGGHPLAGSHKTGVGAARADLFKDAVCVLVPPPGTSAKPLQSLWRSVGARPLLMSSSAHDAAVSITSHLPHLLAHALVHAVRRRPSQSILKRLMAGSFRDVTRVASSDPDQWTEIFAANAPALRQALRDFSRELQRLSHQIGRKSLRTRLHQSQRYRLPLFHEL